VFFPPWTYIECLLVIQDENVLLRFSVGESTRHFGLSSTK